MVDKQTLTTKLVELLAEIEFDRKYYDFYRSLADSEDRKTNLSRADFETALLQISLAFDYHKGEDFFLYRGICPSVDVELRVAFTYNSAEFILTVKTVAGSIGGPFPRLARLVALQRDANFSPFPRSPKLPFANKQELQSVVEFGVSLFEEAKMLICSYDGWY
jgi:hypothetical protein